MPPGELVAIPAHPPFFLGSTPVTNGSYAAFVETGRVAAPPWWNDPDFRRRNQPVGLVGAVEPAAGLSILGLRLPGAHGRKLTASPRQLPDLQDDFAEHVSFSDAPVRRRGAVERMALRDRDFQLRGFDRAVQPGE